MKCVCNYQHFEIQKEDGEFEIVEGNEPFTHIGTITTNSTGFKAIMMACPKCKTVRIQ